MGYYNTSYKQTEQGGKHDYLNRHKIFDKIEYPFFIKERELYQPTIKPGNFLTEIVTRVLKAILCIQGRVNRNKRQVTGKNSANFMTIFQTEEFYIQ